MTDVGCSGCEAEMFLCWIETIHGVTVKVHAYRQVGDALETWSLCLVEEEPAEIGHIMRLTCS